MYYVSENCDKHIWKTIESFSLNYLTKDCKKKTYIFHINE